MATEGVRRSTRKRIQVKSYAEEQAEDSAVAIEAAPPKRKRKAPSNNDGDDEIDTTGPITRASEKSKTSKEGNAALKEDSSRKSAKAASSKPKRTATNVSWHESAAVRRIAVNNRNIRQLVPGQQEKRLRE